MLCIAASTYVDNNDRKTSSPEAWLKPAADMEALFADLPEAIANTAVIAQRCAVAAPKRKPILPRLSDDEDETLRREAHAGLAGTRSRQTVRRVSRRRASRTNGSLRSTATASISRSTSSPAWGSPATS